MPYTYALGMPESVHPMTPRHSRSWLRAYAIAAFLTASMNCRGGEVRSLPSYFVVPAEARAVAVKRDDGGIGASYSLVDHFPASGAIARVNERLSGLRWKPLEKDWLNPTIPSSHSRGWQAFLDRTGSPALAVHQWTAQWENSAGDLVAYSFRFAEPVEGSEVRPPTPAGANLSVSIIFVPAADRKTIEVERFGKGEAGLP